MDVDTIRQIQPQLIDLKKINLSPGPYCMSYDFDVHSYAECIEKIGLLNFPLLHENEKGAYEIIIGYRRIHAVKMLGWKTIRCRIADLRHMSPFKYFCLNLYDNLSTRQLNDIEKAMVIRRLTKWVKTDEIVRMYMPLIGLPAHEKTLLFYLKIDKIKGKELKTGLAARKISLSAMSSILEMDQHTQRSIFNLLININFNKNQQKQLIEYLIDLTHIKKKSISELLNDSMLSEVLLNTRLNHPQKAKAALRILKSLRFPILDKAEKTFQKKISTLRLPKGAKISAAPYFEAPYYQLNIQFRNGYELKQVLDELSRISGLDELANH